mmetsp:Transcript_15495/g.31459  ORF Transcript_15495/g.31459 Transcript_15495/m.31459 type:complete len:201 (+) Transcript_15495:156-758(+)
MPKPSGQDGTQTERSGTSQLPCLWMPSLDGCPLPPLTTNAPEMKVIGRLCKIVETPQVLPPFPSEALPPSIRWAPPPSALAFPLSSVPSVCLPPLRLLLPSQTWTFCARQTGVCSSSVPMRRKKTQRLWGPGGTTRRGSGTSPLRSPRLLLPGGFPFSVGPVQPLCSSRGITRSRRSRERGEQGTRRPPFESSQGVSTAL